MGYQVTRRRFIVAGGSFVFAPLVLAGCGGPRRGGPGGSPSTLRIAWWGSQARSDRTNKAIDLFKAKHKGLRVTPDSTADYDAYWQKINTQATGGNAPDLYQHNYRYLKQFSDSNSLFDLNKLPAGTLDLTNADPTMVDQAVINGKRLALPLGANTEALYVNTGLIKDALPAASWTWADFADFVDNTMAKLPKGCFVSDDNSGSDIILEPWLLERGKQFYTEDGQLGFSGDDLTAYFQYWADLRKSGGLSPGDLQAQSASDQRMAEHKVATVWGYSNQMTAFQSETKDKLAIHTYPAGPTGSPPGHTVIATGLLMAVSANSKNAKTAGQLLNFMINDPAGIRALGTERGVPLSTKAQAMLRPILPTTEQTALDFFAQQAKNPTKKSVYYTAPPAGAGELTTLLAKTGQDLAFGKVTIGQAADRFMRQAPGVLK